MRRAADILLGIMIGGAAMYGLVQFWGIFW
jgi:hypothetical protein